MSEQRRQQIAELRALLDKNTRRPVPGRCFWCGGDAEPGRRYCSKDCTAEALGQDA